MSETVLHQTLGQVTIVKRGDITSIVLADGVERVVSNSFLVEPKPLAPVVVEEPAGLVLPPPAPEPEPVIEPQAEAPATNNKHKTKPHKAKDGAKSRTEPIAIES